MLSEDTPRNDFKQAIAVENGNARECFFSPRFKSVAAMAGWDEEELIFASLVVEDTPDRSSSKHRKRHGSQFKTPPSSNSRRKRTAKRNSMLSTVPIVQLDQEKLEEIDSTQKSEQAEGVKEETIAGTNKLLEKKSGVWSSKEAPLCMDKLRDELSCAICLEICFEPSTTSCGHSFCKKCLRSAADKCGKRCPKCRQLISGGRSCTINTVLWNTIQLLFPQEVDARKNSTGKSPALKDKQTESTDARVSRGETSGNDGDHSFPREDLSRLLRSNSTQRSARRLGRRNGIRGPSQNEDAALALRLQREEFMDAFGNRQRRSTLSSARENFLAEELLESFSNNQSRRTSSLSSARDNLRAMASRAAQIRRRRGQGM